MTVKITFEGKIDPVPDALELAQTLENLIQNHEELQDASGEVNNLCGVLEELSDER